MQESEGQAATKSRSRFAAIAIMLLFLCAIVVAVAAVAQMIIVAVTRYADEPPRFDPDHVATITLAKSQIELENQRRQLSGRTMARPPWVVNIEPIVCHS